ncbi:MAG: hypothetical protein AAF317_04745, partial [Pseudomonadota bacterium]
MPFERLRDILTQGRCVLPAEVRRFLDTTRRDILVISDRYPPEAVGGAEISLHLCLQRGDLADRALVIVFSRNVLGPRLYWQDRVPVLMLPDADAWPIHFAGAGSYAAASRLGHRVRDLYTYTLAAACLIAAGPVTQVLDRATALWLEVTGKPKGGIASDFAL